MCPINSSTKSGSLIKLFLNDEESFQSQPLVKVSLELLKNSESNEGDCRFILLLIFFLSSITQFIDKKHEKPQVV